MKKIIPCLDTKDGVLVKGVNFKNIETLGDPVDFAREYEKQGADELVLLDISKTEDGHAMRTKLIKDVSSAINMPLTLGGGISSIEDIKKALDAGADKVSIGSASIKNPDFINDAVENFSSDQITIGIDMAYVEEEGDYYIFSQAGKKKEDIKALDWIKEMEERGAGRLLITSIDHDGVKEGFDIDFLKLATDTVGIPIIASGGAGSIEDFIELFRETDVESGLAASIFHRGQVNIIDLKKRLKEEGIDV